MGLLNNEKAMARDSGCRVANREIMYAPRSFPSQRKVHTHDAAHAAAANRISIAARIAQLFLKGMCRPRRESGARLQ